MATNAGVRLTLDRLRHRQVRWQRLYFDRFAVRYAVSGRGPAVVLPKKDLSTYLPGSALADRYTFVQIEPLGFCRSDRPPPYELSVADQVLTVCDAAGIDDFAIWGYSQGGAMACTVARASSRVRALVCGGFNVLRDPGTAWLARANRQRRIPESARAFWNDFSRFDWHHELKHLGIPKLMYFGTVDPHRLRRPDVPVVQGVGVDVLPFEGLGHADLGLSDETSARAVARWLDGNYRAHRTG